MCAARTAFPQGQVTRSQAELRGQPRSPLPRGRAPEGSQLRAARREAAPSRPWGLCHEPLSGPERPLAPRSPPAHPFPGLDAVSVLFLLGAGTHQISVPRCSANLGPCPEFSLVDGPFLPLQAYFEGTGQRTPTYPPPRFPQEHVIFLALSHPYHLTAIPEFGPQSGH